MLWHCNDACINVQDVPLHLRETNYEMVLGIVSSLDRPLWDSGRHLYQHLFDLRLGPEVTRSYIQPDTVKQRRWPYSLLETIPGKIGGGWKTKRLTCLYGLQTRTLRSLSSVQKLNKKKYNYATFSGMLRRGIQWPPNKTAIGKPCKMTNKPC